MKVSNEKLVNSVGTLRKISNTELPIKVSFNLAKNIGIIEKELETFNNEKSRIIEKYAVKDADNKVIVAENGTVNIASENVQAWNIEISELLKQENKVDLYSLDIKDIEKCNLLITPSEILLIDYMLK